jgi:GNAT superfamily N-acetyltransferase
MIDHIPRYPGILCESALLKSTSMRPIVASEWIERAAPLLQQHWEEIALNKQLMVLKPDAETYRRLEQQNKLVSVGAFAGDELVGYSVNLLQNHLHYADLVVAMNDVLYLAPEYRQGSAGRRLLDATEKAVRDRGARMLCWHAKPETALNAILPRLGYGVQDVIFSKEL